MNRVIAIVAVLIVLAGGAYWWVSRPDTTAVPTTQEQTATGDTSATSAQFDVTEMTLGQVDAPIEVIEYASFTCPHCANAHATLIPELKKNYVDTGKIRFTYREVYFDKYGMWASLIARCGGADKFFGIADLMYKGQAEWARAGSDAAIADELRKIGRLAGIETEALDACLNDADQLQTLVSWYQANAETHKIESTPSFIIDGEKYANMNYADFSAILDAKLAQ